MVPQKTAFDPVLKLSAIWLYLAAGEKPLTFLYQNLGFPSAESVRHWFHTEFQAITEGEIRTLELCEFIRRHNFPKFVWIGEDATKITAKMEYNHQDDEVVGLAKPLHPLTGFPLQKMFPAKSLGTMKQFSDKYPVANYVNAILAKPLVENAPSFTLALFGTNNDFSAKDVTKRVDFITKKLKEEGITVVGTSSDAASAYLKSQKSRMKLGHNLSLSMSPSQFWSECWACDLNIDEVQTLQDVTHELTKLRNRFYKPSDPLKVGEYLISITDIQVTMTKNYL